MHLHTLTFQAIGPFAGQHTIDFAELGQSGLFLLEGPTGSGKSTIIDAIVFALYGGLAGETASKQRMHSHHADPGVEPYVDLVFETRSGVYRIRRSPAHERPKVHGDAMTSVNESAKLWKLGSADAPDIGETLSLRTQEIGGHMTTILGLDRKQFLQTVVLPQGEFAKFLRSSGEERKTLLQTIFRTDLYEHITKCLGEMRREARSAVDTAKTAVSKSIAVFDEASQAGGPPQLDERDDLAVLETFCAEIVATIREDEAAVSSVELQAREAVIKARDFHEEQKNLSQHLQERASLLNRKASLDQRAPEVAIQGDRVDAARRSQAVKPSILGFLTAEHGLKGAEERLGSCRSDFGEGADHISLTELRDSTDRAASDITNLGQLVTLETQFPAREKNQRELTAQDTELQSEILQLEQQTDNRPAARRLLDIERDAAQAMAGDEPAARLEHETAKAIVQAAEKAVLKSGELRNQRIDRDLAIAAARQAVAGEAHVRQQRLDGIAGVLAQELVDDQPCAVCGSLDHPNPAALSSEHPSAEDIETASTRRVDSERGATDAGLSVTRSETELKALLAESRGLSVDDALSLVLDASSRVEGAVNAALQLASIGAQLTTMDRETADDAAALSATRVRQARLLADLKNNESTLEADRLKVATALNGRAVSLSDLVAGLESRRMSGVTLMSALEANEVALTLRDGRSRELTVTLGDNGFLSVEEAQGAALDDALLRQLETDIKTYESEAAIVADGLERESIKSLTGDEVPHIEAALADAALREASHEDAKKAANLIGARLHSADKAFNAVKQALAGNKAASAEATAIVRMADIADASGPANLKKLTLGTYVLIRRFEEVVKSANARLGPMSNGRYQLQHIHEKEGVGGSRKTGLALSIIDGETNKSREPRTFSGGETFYASLCLALGLADVVTGEAGGMDLGTLFVDEGFGSLDSETLDNVMAELGKLSKGGRVVGIVSHVEELKQRVGDSIEVRRNGDGSSSLTSKSG